MRSLVLVLALVAVAAACADRWVSDDARHHARSARVVALPATSTTLDQPAPARFRDADCPMPVDAEDAERVRCGFLEVPVDRQEPAGPLAEIAVAIIASSAEIPASDPVVYLHGGPGGLALSDYIEWVFPEHPLLSSRDVILMDQRGSGWSTPSLNCPTAEDSSAPISALEECADALQAAGVELEHFTTTDIVTDLVDLRVALGVEQWNLYGVSYGTRVALRALAMDGPGVRSAVLDSPYPPAVDAYAEEVDNASAAIDALLVDCDLDSRCGDAFGDLRQPLDTLLADLADDPVPTVVDGDDGSPRLLVDDAVLASALFSALYDRFLVPELPLAIQTAIDGDLAGALDRLGAADGLRPARQEPDDDYDSRYDSELAFWAPECAEEISLADLDAITEATATDGALEAALLTEVSDSFAVCARLDVESDDPATQAPIESDIPTLIIVGQYDPITPPSWAALTAGTLDSVAVVEVPGSGHAPGFENCPRDAVVAFVDDQILPPSANCLAALRPLPFATE